MKNVQDLKKKKSPIVVIDPALDKHHEKIMFPEKLKRVNKMLKTAKLPARKHQS
ncbi:MAG: hypothetical protein ACTHLE_24545 [Agriterribacter sp.]